MVERLKEPGSVIKAGDPIFTLVAVGSYWGLAHVDEARAGFIEVGQPVEARLRSRPLESFTGRVVRIGLESDRVTEERRVYLRGDNPPAQIIGRAGGVLDHGCEARQRAARAVGRGAWL